MRLKLRNRTNENTICLKYLREIPTRLAFTCSTLTIEILEQGVKYVQVNNKDIRSTPMSNFKHVIAGWG